MYVALAIAGIVIVTAATFFNVTGNGFVWDDKTTIEENPVIREFSLSNIRSMFSIQYNIREFFNPTRWLAYAAIYRFFGLDAGAYHAASLLLHIIDAVLVFVLLMKISRANIFVSFVAGMLFAIHPTRVESVAWATQLKDQLYALFFLLSFLAFISYRRGDNKRYYMISFILYALSLMSKPTASTLPLLLVLWDYYEHSKFKKIFILDKIPFLVLIIPMALMVITVRNAALKDSGLEISDVEKMRPFFSRALLTINSVSFYLHKTIYPRALSALYPYPEDISILSWKYYVPVIVFVLILGACIVSLRYTKKVFFGFFFFLIVISPHSQIVAHGGYSYVDRGTYIPLVGFFWIFAYFLYQFWKMQKFRLAGRIGCVLLLAGVFGALSFLSFKRTEVWKDNMALWKSVLEYDPNCGRAHYYLGAAYRSAGDQENALKHYARSIELDPDAVSPRMHTANIYYEKGDFNKALEFYREVLKKRPKKYAALLNVGNIFRRRKDYERAIDFYTRAIESKPDVPDAYVNLGGVYQELGRPEDAAQYYGKALELRRENFEALYHYAQLSASLGRHKEALKKAKKALSLKPDHSEARLLAARCYINLSQYNKAIKELEQLLERNPENTAAHFTLGLVYQKLGFLDLAVKYYERAIEIDEHNVEAFANLAFVFKKKKMHMSAHRIYEKGLKLNKDSPTLLYGLATLLAEENKFEEALSALDRALAGEPNFVQAHILKAEIFKKQGNISLARDELLRGRKKTSDAGLQAIINEKLEELPEGEKSGDE